MDGVPEAQAPVTVSLDDLRTGQPFTHYCTYHQTKLNEDAVSFNTLEQAFGPSSLGILLVSGLPSTFLPLRHKLLSYASHLAHLPSTELGTNAPSMFLQLETTPNNHQINSPAPPPPTSSAGHAAKRRSSPDTTTRSRAPTTSTAPSTVTRPFRMPPRPTSLRFRNTRRRTSGRRKRCWQGSARRSRTCAD